MRLLFLGFLSVILLASCTSGRMGDDNSPTPQKPKPNTVQSGSAPQPTETVYHVNYTLHDTTATGKVLDTSYEQIAKQAGIYSTGRTYEPLPVTIGGGGVIPGFERAILTMKPGEKKTVQILPKDGYGEEYFEQTVDKRGVLPEFSFTTDRQRFESKVIQTFPRSTFGEMGKTLVVGQTFSGNTSTTGKVLSASGDTLTVEIDNKMSPFYGKTLAVGLKAEIEGGGSLEIKGLTQTGITIFAINKQSPFYGQKIVPGITGKTTDSYGKGVEIRLMSLSGETAQIQVKNPVPLAGKTLYFELELVSISGGTHKMP